MEYGKITLKMGIRMNIVYYTYWYMEKKIKKKKGWVQSIFFYFGSKNSWIDSSIFLPVLVFFFFCSNLLYLFKSNS